MKKIKIEDNEYWAMGIALETLLEYLAM